MTRAFFGLMGVLLALLPKGVTRLYELVAFENPEACEPRRRLTSIARVEGVAFALAALAGGRAYDRLMDLTGVAAALALVFPRRYLETGASIVYEDSEELEWREGFVTAARVIGAVFLLLSIRAYRKRSRKETDEKNR